MKSDLENKDTFNNDIDRFIANRFPSFSSGQSGSLLHGLIHLGYGLSCKNKQVILEGMSYIPHSYLHFDYKPPSNDETYDGNLSILKVLDMIRQDGILKQNLYDNFHKVLHIPLGTWTTAIYLFIKIWSEYY